MSSGGHEFLLRQWDCVKEGLHRGLAEAPAALMRSTMVVFNQPSVEIGLQLVDRVIDLLAERDPVKLVQDCAMETLADSIRLRALGFGAAVIDVLNREIELVFMALGAAELGATVSQPEGGPRSRRLREPPRPPAPASENQLRQSG